jgi:hypothetical protein
MHISFIFSNDQNCLALASGKRVVVHTHFFRFGNDHCLASAYGKRPCIIVCRRSVTKYSSAHHTSRQSHDPVYKSQRSGTVLRRRHVVVLGSVGIRPQLGSRTHGSRRRTVTCFVRRRLSFMVHGSTSIIVTIARVCLMHSEEQEGREFNFGRCFSERIVIFKRGH